ncbi:SDR family oxidoreductase [Cohnella sp. 56]|uniref:SDR family oxidoreductase n=1 Tax=Cohnella sp. 56 TaxID=3113722 RepID=UPI0030E9B552
MTRRNGKVALVTGASRGIGRSIALRLAADGATVAVHYGSNRDRAEEIVREIRTGGGSAFAIGADLASAGGIEALFEALDGRLDGPAGGTRLDILVNNAGIGQQIGIGETTEASLDEVLNINVKAPILVIREALKRMNDGGSIINLSSAVTRIPLPNLLGYSVSKGAINTLTLNLAQELGGRGIRVNAIQPGIIDTDMNTATLQDPGGRAFAAGLSVFGRWGQPEDVADIAAFLASPDSRWVTGQLIDASGGSRL